MYESQVMPDSAGVGSLGGVETVSGCMKFAERPSTPPEVAKWRQSSVSVPGTRVIHPGYSEDFKDHDHQIVFGNTSDRIRDTTSQLLNQAGGGGALERIDLEQKEAVYLSKARDVLGKRFILGGMDIPDRCRDTSFAFGGQSKGIDESSKDIMCPIPCSNEDLARELYRKSHNAYDPGEQILRDYDWPVDPNTSRFGMRTQEGLLGSSSASVAAVLRGTDSIKERRIISKRVEDFHNTKDHLGHSRSLGHDHSHLARDHIFGKASQGQRDGEWNTKQCLEGMYPIEEQLPDSDLGCTLTPGFRNTGADGRVFGVPSIRTDLKSSYGDNHYSF